MTSDFIAARSSRLSGFAVWSDSDLGSSNGTAYDYNVIKVHVILGSLATMLFLPLGILIPRYARGLSTARWWFPAHMTVQGLAALLAIGALGIALYLGGAGGSSHQALGVILVVGVILQIALGIFVHWYKAAPHRFQATSGRGPSHFIHFILGVLIVIFGWATAWTGLDAEWGVYSGRGSPSTGWKIGWGFIVAIFAVAYLVGLAACLPRQRRLEREGREKRAIDVNQGGYVSPEAAPNTYEMSRQARS